MDVMSTEPDFYRKIEGTYSCVVGRDGTVWRDNYGRWSKVKPTVTHGGYCVVKVQWETRRVHRLVLEAFVGPCQPGMEACHYPDRNPANNALSNLRWGTSASNKADRVHHGTAPIGVNNARAKLADCDVMRIRERAADGEDFQRLAFDFDVSRSTIQKIVVRKRWTHLV